MIFLEETTTRLSLAVIFSDAIDPNVKIPQQAVSLVATGILHEPYFHRAGYWLFLDLQAGQVNLSWKSTQFEDGAQGIDISTLPSQAPIVTISLVKPPPS